MQFLTQGCMWPGLEAKLRSKLFCRENIQQVIKSEPASVFTNVHREWVQQLILQEWKFLCSGLVNLEVGNLKVVRKFSLHRLEWILQLLHKPGITAMLSLWHAVTRSQLHCNSWEAFLPSYLVHQISSWQVPLHCLHSPHQCHLLKTTSGTVNITPIEVGV